MTQAAGMSVEAAPEVAALLEELMRAASAGDGAAVEQVISPNEALLFIGTDPGEWFRDTGEIRRMIEAQAGAGVTVVAHEVNAYRHGAVAWAATRGAFRLPDGAEVPFRMTAVFCREDGGWKLIQEHASIPISNQEAIGQDLG